MKLSNNWASDFISASKASETISSITKLADTHFKSAGFNWMGYRYVPNIGAAEHSEKAIEYFPRGTEEWAVENLDKANISRDGIKSYMLKHAYPVWTADLLKFEDFQSEDQQSHLKTLINSQGTGHGLIIPVFGPRRSRGIFLLPMGLKAKRPEQTVINEVEYVCFHVHREYCRIHASNNSTLELTPREADVLQLLPLGLSNRDIAEILKISPNTVNSYLQHLFMKLGTSDRLTTSLRALALDLID